MTKNLITLIFSSLLILIPGFTFAETCTDVAAESVLVCLEKGSLVECLQSQPDCTPQDLEASLTVTHLTEYVNGICCSKTKKIRINRCLKNMISAYRTYRKGFPASLRARIIKEIKSQKEKVKEQGQC